MDSTREQMSDLVLYFQAELAKGATSIEIEILDPDLGVRDGRRLFAGETVKVGDTAYLHRPWRVWIDLAERLGMRMCTPQPAIAPRLELRFERLDPEAQIKGGPEGTEKYGADTDFMRVNKEDDPGFLIDLQDALSRMGIGQSWRVLDLGCGTGSEIMTFNTMCRNLITASYVGVDHSASAINRGTEIYSRNESIQLIHADVTKLDPASWGTYDLVIAIGLFQSGALDDRELLRKIFQSLLKPGGCILIGIPNCRYVDGEVIHGARMKNFSQPELGLVIKDIAFYRKYLQQHGMQVYVTGKNYLFVTGVPRGGPTAEPDE